MDFNFVFPKDIKKAIQGSKVENFDIDILKSVHIYSPYDLILLNLGAKQFKYKKEDYTIEEIAVALQHEYLHKAIRSVQQELNINEVYEKLGHLKEEEIITEIVGEKYEVEIYKRAFGL